MIYDRSGLTLDKSKAALNLIKHLSEVLNNYYPEVLYKSFILKPNWIFKLGYNIAKSFIGARTI